MTRPLTPPIFDRLTEIKPASRVIWTAQGIANRIGCSPDYVRGPLASHPGSPIRKIGGRWFVEETALLEFLQNRL